jgi:hypothetical protein
MIHIIIVRGKIHLLKDLDLPINQMYYFLVGHLNMEFLKERPL